MNADLHLGDEAVNLRIDCGVHIGLNGPAAESLSLIELDRCQWRRKRMILRGHSHCLAKVGAAQNRKSVHAIGRDMDRRTDAIWQLPVAREKLWGGRRRSWQLH